MKHSSIHDVGRALTTGGGSSPLTIEWGRRQDTDQHVVHVSNTEPPIPANGVPHIVLERHTANFSGVIGGVNPYNQSIDTDNTGTGTFENYSITSDVSWLTTVPKSGSGIPVIDIIVNTAGLTSSGLYHGVITFAVPGADNTPQTIAVTLTMYPDGTVTYPPINKKLLLGYFHVSSKYGELVSAAIPGKANCAVSLGYHNDYLTYDDNGMPVEDPNWASRQTAAVDALAGYGATALIGATTQEVANLTSRWDRVEGFYTSLEAMSGATTLDQVYALENKIRDIRAAMFAAGLSNRPFLTYFNKAQCESATWVLPDGCDWIGVECYLDGPGPATGAECKAAMKSMILTRLGLLRAKINQDWGIKFILIAQAYDRQPSAVGWTNEANLAAMQTAFSEVAAENADVAGMIYFTYGRPGGTANYLLIRREHEAIYRSVINGKPPISTPSYPAYGAMEVVDASTISGWAFDPDRPNQVVQVQVFDGPRRASGSTRIGQIAASTARPDIIATTKDLGNHGWSMNTPSSVKDSTAHNIWAYGVNYGTPVGQQNPLVGSPTSLTVAGTPNELTGSGNAIKKGGASFLYKGATCFSAIREILDHGSSAMDSKLNWWAAKGVNVLRCFGMLGVTNHGANAFGPQETGYDTAWTSLLDAAKSRNIVIEATLFADASEVPGAISAGDRLAYAKRMAQLFNPYWNVMVEMANEPWQNGFSGNSQLISLATEMVALNPHRMYSLGCTTDRMSLANAVAPATYLTVHTERFGAPRDWRWIQALAAGTYPPITQADRPMVSNEPENATRTGGFSDPSEARWYAYGALAQLRRFHTTFHYGDGKYTGLPDATTETLLNRWLQGISDFSYDYGGNLFIGIYPTAGQSLVVDTGDILFAIGRKKATSGMALVVAKQGYSPSTLPGWTATLHTLVNDPDTVYCAHYVTYST